MEALNDGARCYLPCGLWVTAEMQEQMAASSMEDSPMGTWHIPGLNSYPGREGNLHIRTLRWGSGGQSQEVLFYAVERNRAQQPEWTSQAETISTDT